MMTRDIASMNIISHATQMDDDFIPLAVTRVKSSQVWGGRLKGLILKERMECFVHY